jgi:hypothetical protein
LWSRWSRVRVPSATLDRRRNSTQDRTVLAVFRGDASLLREAQTEARHGGELLLHADSGLPPGEVRSLSVIGDPDDVRLAVTQATLRREAP